MEKAHQIQSKGPVIGYNQIISSKMLYLSECSINNYCLLNNEFIGIETEEGHLVLNIETEEKVKQEIQEQMHPLPNFGMQEFPFALASNGTTLHQITLEPSFKGSVDSVNFPASILEGQEIEQSNPSGNEKYYLA